MAMPSEWSQGTTCVGVCDILGFGEWIESEKLENLSRLATSLLEEAKEEAEAHVHGSRIDTALVSDTIIVWCPRDAGKDDAPFVAMVLGNLFRRFLDRGLALRGAISYGDLYVDRSSNLLIGSALIRAHRCEKSQTWAGAIIEDSLRPAIDEYLGAAGSAPWARDLFVTYSGAGPSREGGKEFLCLDWIKDFAATRTALPGVIFKRDPERRHAKLTEKFTNTLAFLEFCEDRRAGRR